MRMNFLSLNKAALPLVEANASAINLHRKSVELSRHVRKSPIARSIDLISAMLSNGARARRASKEPVIVKLNVYMPSGKRAATMGYK